MNENKESFAWHIYRHTLVLFLLFLLGTTSDIAEWPEWGEERLDEFDPGEQNSDHLMSAMEIPRCVFCFLGAPFFNNVSLVRCDLCARCNSQPLSILYQILSYRTFHADHYECLSRLAMARRYLDFVVMLYRRHQIRPRWDCDFSLKFPLFYLDLLKKVPLRFHLGDYEYYYSREKGFWVQWCQTHWSHFQPKNHYEYWFLLPQVMRIENAYVRDRVNVGEALFEPDVSMFPTTSLPYPLSVTHVTPKGSPGSLSDPYASFWFYWDLMIQYKLQPRDFMDIIGRYYRGDMQKFSLILELYLNWFVDTSTMVLPSVTLPCWWWSNFLKDQIQNYFPLMKKAQLQTQIKKEYRLLLPLIWHHHWAYAVEFQRHATYWYFIPRQVVWYVLVPYVCAGWHYGTILNFWCLQDALKWFTKLL